MIEEPLGSHVVIVLEAKQGMATRVRGRGHAGSMLEVKYKTMVQCFQIGL